MSHRKIDAPKPRAVIGSPWYVRKAAYVIVTIGGLVAVAFGLASPDQVDSWIAQASSIVTQIIPLLTVIGGGMAALNTGRESDEKPVGVEVAPAPAPTPEPQPIYDGFTAYPEEVRYAD